jgi:hypothetical protein
MGGVAQAMTAPETRQESRRRFTDLRDWQNDEKIKEARHCSFEGPTRGALWRARDVGWQLQPQSRWKLPGPAIRKRDLNVARQLSTKRQGPSVGATSCPARPPRNPYPDQQPNLGTRALIHAIEELAKARGVAGTCIVA